jgi:hypothetical protein
MTTRPASRHQHGAGPMTACPTLRPVISTEVAR